MKRHMNWLMTLAMLIAMTFDASAGVSTSAKGAPIRLKKSYTTGWYSGSSRMPEHDNLSLEVCHNEVTNSLVFYDTNATDIISFQVYDESGTMVLGAVCTFDVEGYYSTSIIGLDSGTYTLKVFINGTEYHGTFEV